MDRDPVERCPRCGTRADATATVELPLAPSDRDALGRFAEIIRRELGLQTDPEAIVEAARRVALELNQS